MKQFFKFTFASCLGVMLAGIFLFFLFMIIAVGLASGGSGKVKIANESVLQLTFNQPIPERTNNISASSLISMETNDVLGLQDVIALINKAKKDDKIKGIHLNPMNSGLGLAKASAIQNALLDFKESGKFITSYADYYTQGDYYLAAAANRIFLNPIGTVDFRGFATYTPFFKDVMDKVGFKMNIYYAGDFKSATEPYRRNDMSPANRLQTKEFLDAVYDGFLEDIGNAREGISKKDLKEIAYQFKIKYAEDAKTYGLVDEVGFTDELYRWMQKEMGNEGDKAPKFVSLQDYATAVSYKNFGKGKDKIAVVYAEGQIIVGKESYGSITDEQYVEIFRKIRNTDAIKAVVLRVNSPGGNILAAEKIYREILLTKEAGKKIVVSMGDLAASGGYYIAAPADSIFCAPNTLTGSIGVFSMIPNFTELLNDKVGIHFDTVRTGPYSADFTPYMNWSEAEHKYLQHRTDTYYQLFLERVASGRNMTTDDVHKIAQGRIWNGKKAVEINLVDRIATLQESIESAANLVGLEEYRITEYPKLLNPLEKFIKDITNPQAAQEDLILAKLEESIPELGHLRMLQQFGQPQARLPILVDF